MKYVAQEITEFTATTLTDLYNDWSSTTTYTFESGTPTNASVARYGAYYWRSVTANNLNNIPYDGSPYWIKWQISNKYAMLDVSAQSKSVYSDEMYVEFVQGYISTLGIGNFSADKIKVEALDIDGSTVLWTYETTSFIHENVTDYYSYIYEPYDYDVDRAIKIDIPQECWKLRVTFIPPSPGVETGVGFMVGGLAIDMGRTLSTVGFKFNSYAKKEIDEFGTMTITKRAVQDVVDFETLIEADNMKTYRNQIKRFYNDIVMFIIDESDTSPHDNMLVLGTIQDASVVHTEFDKTVITWTVMESV